MPVSRRNSRAKVRAEAPAIPANASSPRGSAGSDSSASVTRCSRGIATRGHRDRTCRGVADLVQRQRHDVPHRSCFVPHHRLLARRQDQLAQEGRHGDDRHRARTGACRILAQEQRPHRQTRRHARHMRRPCRHPQAGAGRHDEQRRAASRHAARRRLRAAVARADADASRCRADPRSHTHSRRGGEAPPRTGAGGSGRQGVRFETRIVRTSKDGQPTLSPGATPVAEART